MIMATVVEGVHGISNNYYKFECSISCTPYLYETIYEYTIQSQ